MSPINPYIWAPERWPNIQKKGSEIMDYRERRSFDRGPREMHKATCSDCGKECEVPFTPTEGRPVYCNECFAKHRPPRRY